MSMTYYAVTDDPNELAHYGILGMKWGVRNDKPRHTGSKRPRSAAYKKAQSKLGRMMKSGIKKAQTKWEVYNSPANKQLRAEKRYERQTNKAIQQARKGKLKYGKLTDDQVQRVTERLYLERQARQLADTEKSFGRRLKESIGEGIISGIGSGVGRKTSEWIFRGSQLKTDRLRNEQQEEFDKARAKRQFKQELKNDAARDRYEAKMSTQERKQKRRIAEEYYKVTADEDYRPTHLTSKGRAKYLAEVKARNKKNDYSANIQKIYDEQMTRSRAISDRQREDWKRNAIANQINNGSRKLQPTGALRRLNAENRVSEARNEYNDKKLYRIEANNQRRLEAARSEREQARKDKAFNEALRNKQRQDAAREAARSQQAQARMEQEQRARIDRQNTSRKRRKGKN